MVSIQQCKSYEYKEIKEALLRTLAPLGGMTAFVKPGMRVAVKPNLVLGKKPEECATTHPAVIRAVCELIGAAGGTPVISESPGGPYNRQSLKAIYQISGMAEAAQKGGAELNFDTTFREVSHPEGETVKRMNVITPVLDCDAVINVCKLKTHGMTLYTGAVKNLFGVIPGTYKAEYHFRMPELSDFCNMLVDINTFVRPTLSVMDAVTAMEGAGPTGGTKRETGLLLACESPYELDLAASHLAGFAPDEVLTVKNAVRRGLCPADASELELIGEPLEPHCCKFERPASSTPVDFLSKYPQWVKRIGTRLVRPKPVFLHEKCAGCGECAKCCPAKTIRMENRRPFVELKSCIRCFCCQELCRFHAVEIRRPIFMKLVNKL